MHRHALLAALCVAALAACGPAEPDQRTPPLIAFESAQLTHTEGDGPVEVAVVLSQATDVPVVARIVTPTGDASCEIAAGQTRCAWAHPVVDDDVEEADETITFELAAATNATVSDPARLTVTVVDNDLAPRVVGFGVGVRTLTEGSDASVEVQLDAAARVDVRVPFTVSGTASLEDHTLRAGEFVVPAGQTRAAVSFSIVDDEIDEPDETLVISLGTPVNGLLGLHTVQTITIVDNDPAPVAAFANAAMTVGEGTGTASIQLALDRPSAFEVEVAFTVAGTASAQDHGLAAGSFKFPAGETSARVQFAIVDDALDEEDETIVVTLGQATNATVGQARTLTVTITDDDAPPAVTFAKASTVVGEADGRVTVDVTLGAPSGRTVRVPFTVAGTASKSEHDLVPGTLVFAPGETAKQIAFNVIDDDTDEDAKTIVIAFGALVNATAGAIATHTVTVNDDDAPSVAQFVSAAQTRAEGTKSVTAIVQLDRASERTITVDYSLGGTASRADHTLTAGTLTLHPGEVEKRLVFDLVGDDVHEGNETLVITLDRATHATIGQRATHTVTIVDDDPVPSVGFERTSDSVSETGPTYTVRVVLSGKTAFAVDVPFSVSGTADSEDHGLADGLLTIDPERTATTITIPLFDDLIREGDETIVLTLGTPTNATLRASAAKFTLTLIDDEKIPSVSFNTATSDIDEGLSATITLELSAPIAEDTTIRVEGPGAPDEPILVTSDTMSVSFTVPTERNGLYDHDGRRQTYEITDFGGLEVGTHTTHTLQVLDVDGVPAVSFDPAQTTELPEGDDGLPFRLHLTHAADAALYVGVRIYGEDSGFVYVEAGSTSAQGVVIWPEDDVHYPEAPVLLVTLGEPRITATHGDEQAALSFTVVDNDPLPSAFIALPTQRVSEGSGQVTVTVSLTGPLSVDTSITLEAVHLGTSPGDFTLPPTPIGISAFSRGVVVTIPIADDEIAEDDKDFAVTITDAGIALIDSARNGQVITIVDDDFPYVSFDATPASVPENQSLVDVTLKLDRPSETVRWVEVESVNELGAVLATTTAVFPANSTSQTVQIANLPDDNFYGPNRTLRLRLNGHYKLRNGTPSSVTIAVQNDDPAPTATISVDQSVVGEQSGALVTFTVSLSAQSLLPATVPLVVSGSARLGVDWTASVPPAVVIPPMQTSASFFVIAQDDQTYTGPRELTVSLGAPTHAQVGEPASATVVLTDDETPLQIDGLVLHLDPRDLPNTSPITAWPSRAAWPNPIDVTATLVAPNPSELRSTRNASIQTSGTLFDAVDGPLSVAIVVKDQSEATDLMAFGDVRVSLLADGTLRVGSDARWTATPAGFVPASGSHLVVVQLGTLSAGQHDGVRLFVDGEETPQYVEQGGGHNGFMNPLGEHPLRFGTTPANESTLRLSEAALLLRDLSDAERRRIECHLSAKHDLGVAGGCP